jgi:hypothetical protein
MSGSNSREETLFEAAGKPPGSMEDLAKAGAIRKMPTPPAGKKYVLAPDKMSVRLVDR